MRARAPRVPFAWDAPPRVVGHRGSPREARENTSESFRAASAHEGVRAVELDARLSADGEVVVHHDAELGRVLAGDGAIEAMKAEDLVARGAPRLADVLALGSALLVNVELKGDGERAGELPARVHEVVKAAGAEDRVLVSSFDHELADAYARLADRPGGMILPFAPDPADLGAYPRLAFVMLAEDAALDEVIAACRDAGKRVYVWTVNDEKRAAGLLAAGAVGVITDRPGPLARALGEASAAP